MWILTHAQALAQAKAHSHTHTHTVHTYLSNTELSWGPTMAHATRNILCIETNYYI